MQAQRTPKPDVRVPAGWEARWDEDQQVFVMRRTAPRKRPTRCPGAGLRVAPTGSSAFPEVRCSYCEFSAAPATGAGPDHGYFYMRAHRPLGEGRWRDA